MPARKLDYTEFNNALDKEEYLDPKIKEKLEKALERIEKGTAVFYTIDELEKRLDATIAKYE